MKNNFKKKKLRKYKPVNNKMIFIMIGILIFISIGFSILTTNLYFYGTVTVKKINFYDVTINVNNTEYGTVSSSSVNIPYGTTYSVSGATLTFSNGTKVTATPTATTGYDTSFSSWSSTSGTITGTTTINANFSRNAKSYTVTINTTNATASSASINIKYGSSNTVTITPASGYYLSSVSCSNGYTTNATTGSSVTSAQTVTISNNNKTTTSTCTFTATPIEYTVAINVTNGTSNASTIKVPYSGTNTVTITPTTGYYFDTVTCTNGYTTNAQTGEDKTSAQIITISNNEKLVNSVCTITILKAGPKFATDSWETIQTNIQNGNYSRYNVGDTRTIDLGSALGTHTLRVANNSNYNCTLTSKTACGFVVEFEDIITDYYMNSTSTNVGGWPASLMRTYVNNDIYNALPEALRNVIIETTVVSGHGSTSGENNFTSTDKLYLLSTAEVWSGGKSYDSAKASTITRQLDYYANNGVTTSSYAAAIKKLNGASIWWLRAARSNNTSDFCYVFSSGNYSHYNANYDRGVSPAFRIG